MTGLKGLDDYNCFNIAEAIFAILFRGQVFEQGKPLI